MLFIGFDPGGKRRCGVAILETTHKAARLEFAVCNSVSDSFQWICEHTANRPVSGAGIDAPLYWSGDTGGWRNCDLFLRSRYPEVKNSVLSSNSAYGSMVVQGPLMAMHLRKKWPKVQVTETHPKVAFYAIANSRHNFKSQRKQMCEWLRTKLSLQTEVDTESEDAWDAIFSAWAAWQGFARNWKEDLIDRDSLEWCPVLDVHYFWPD